MNAHVNSVSTEPTIIFWNLDQQRERALEPDATIQTLGTRAVAAVVAGLDETESGWVLTEEDKHVLAQNVEKVVTALNVKSQMRQNLTIHGRLQGQIFNAPGTSMAFLPGRSLKSVCTS
jgi:hypothetical protein